MKRERTLIDGYPVWFAVCCSSECNSTYLGPFFSEEDAQEEANATTCDNAHFLATYVPDFALVTGMRPSYRSSNVAGVSSLVIDKWKYTHNALAALHPIYEMSQRNVNFDREHPLIDEATPRANQ